MHTPPPLPPQHPLPAPTPINPEPAGNWWTRLGTKGKIGTGVGAFVALSVVLGATGVLDEAESDAAAAATVTEAPGTARTDDTIEAEPVEATVDDAPEPAAAAAPTTEAVVQDSPEPAAEAESVALMPSVVGMDLQAAQDTIQEEGVFFSRSEDATGQDRMQVWDRNWTVVRQEPEPGSPIGEGDAILYVVKDGETAADAPSETPAMEEESAAIMPDVVGVDLQAAQDTIQEAGVFFSRSEDATGQGRMQVWDRNWIVVRQDPAPGTTIGEGDAILYVVKDDEL